MKFQRGKCILSTLFAASTAFAAVTVMLFSGQLQAGESSAANSGVVNSAPIQEPEFYDIGIEYTFGTTMDSYTHRTGTGRLVELVEAPQFIHNGSSTFWDGEVASQVITINFKGLWRFTASGTDEVSGDISASEADWIGVCSLSFALNEDGTKWRIFGGTLPAAFVEPGRAIEVFSAYHGVCLSAGAVVGPVQSVINNLIYDYSHTIPGEEPGYPSSTTIFHQELSTSDRVSDYPDFMLTGQYREFRRYGTEDAYVDGETNFGIIISIGPGVNGIAETK